MSLLRHSSNLFIRGCPEACPLNHHQIKRFLPPLKSVLFAAISFVMFSSLVQAQSSTITTVTSTPTLSDTEKNTKKEDTIEDKERNDSFIKIRFSLDWQWDGSSAPFIMALQNGHFKEEGLDIQFDTAQGSQEAIGHLIAKSHDMAIGDINALIRAYGQQQNPDAVAVMMVYDRPSFSIVGRRSRGITEEWSSLEGKKLGAPTADISYLLWPFIKQKLQLDEKKIQFVDVGFSVRDLMLAQGELDAVFGFSNSTVVNLIARGAPANDIVTLAFSDFELSFYGNAIMVNREFATQHPEAVKGFLRAYVKGLLDTLEDPVLAAVEVNNFNNKTDIEVEQKRIQSIMKHSILTKWVHENGFGAIDPVRMTQVLKEMQDLLNFKESVPLDLVFSSNFLPSQSDRTIPDSIFEKNKDQLTPAPLQNTPALNK